MSVTSSALVLSWVAILALAFIAAGLFERVSALEQQVGPSRGTPTTGVRSLPRDPRFRPDGRPLVLVVASPTCSSCAQLLPHLGRLVERGLDVRLLWENRVGPAGPPEIDTTVVSSQEAALLGATATPHAVIVRSGGDVVWSGAVADIDRLISLTEPIRADREEPQP